MAIVEREDYPAAYQGEDESPIENLRLLMRYSQSENIAEELDDETLGKLASQVREDYQEDEGSTSEMRRMWEYGKKLLDMSPQEKTFPWPNASNVRFPLIMEACIQFGARAYPELVKDGSTVKAKTVGEEKGENEKASRGRRVSKHMNYQLHEEMEEWETDTDKLLIRLPFYGTMFRKLFYDPIRGRVRSRLLDPMKFVVDHNAGSLEDVRRETECLEYCYNDVVEKQRAGIWRDVELAEKDDHQILEQHCWYDLDDDGYEEPYIVTMDKDSSEIMRVVARYSTESIEINESGEVVRIEPDRYYVQYTFIPNIDGGLYGMGFCWLLTGTNQAIDTLINQLIDAGTLANTQGGFLGKGIRIRGGQMRIHPGEWKQVDSSGQNLSQNVVPLPVKEPSATLFNMLQFLIEMGKGLASTKDITTGEMPQANTPATTVLAVIEQGQKVANAIYKRIYRGFKQEFLRIFKLNRDYLDDNYYQKILDIEGISTQDYRADDVDIIPAADPGLSTQQQRLARSQAVMELMPALPMKGKKKAIMERLSAIGVDPEDYMPEGEPTPEEQAMMQAAETQQKVAELEMAEKQADLQKTGAETQEILSKVDKNAADAIEALANAEKDQAMTQIEALRTYIEQFQRGTDGST